MPEGFYTITPGQMNPNSHYYLSFNVGYPNAYDRAYGRTGGDIMVHGVCSSAGCFSMTDAQIAEIYAIAREAFNGGQRAIQMQSFPFRMTAENLAKHRLDPNIAFWKELKNGADHFEVTKAEPEVLVCGKHYVFGAHADHDVDASAPCPANLQRDDQVEAAVAEKEASDDAAVAALVAQGVKPVKIVYQDGGQNAAFAGREDLDPSAPEALAAGPTVITLDNSGKPLPPVVKVAAPPTRPRPLAAPAAANAPPAAAPAQTAGQCDRRFAVRLPQRRRGQIVLRPRRQAKRSRRRSRCSSRRSRSRPTRRCRPSATPRSTRAGRRRWRIRRRALSNPRTDGGSREPLLHHQERRLAIAGMGALPGRREAEAGEQPLVFARAPAAPANVIRLRPRRRASASPAASKARAIPRPRQAGSTETRPI